MAVQHLDNLYKDNHQWLLGWLLSKVGCYHRAEDLTHDTFLRLLQQPERDLDKPRAYLRTVANGLVVDFFRRRSLEEAYQQALTNLPEVAMISAEEQHLLKEALEQLDILLNQLPARVKQVLLMSQLEGLTYVVIAEQLGISLRTVKRDMQQAIIHCLTLSW